MGPRPSLKQNENKTTCASFKLCAPRRRCRKRRGCRAAVLLDAGPTDSPLVPRAREDASPGRASRRAGRAPRSSPTEVRDASVRRRGVHAELHLTLTALYPFLVHRSIVQQPRFLVYAKCLSTYAESGSQDSLRGISQAPVLMTS